MTVEIKMSSTYEQFSAPRTPNEPCLAQFVINELTKQGHPEPERWLNEQRADIQLNVVHGNCFLQRFQINDIWRMRIGSLDEDTIIERMALDNDCDIEIWKSKFSKYVVPFVTMRQL